MTDTNPPDTLRLRLRHIVFGTDSRAGRLFDQCLIGVILASVLAVMLDSVQSIHAQYGAWLYVAEWAFTLIFTVEYLLRLWISERPSRYASSFYGIVDLLSIVPTYLSLLVPGAHYLLTLRILRVLRIFRVMKLFSFVSEANFLIDALVRARRKVVVFLLTVLVIMVSFGSLMYVIEGPENGFTSIPVSIY
jgi:voltage-gated potassium channel